MTARLTLICHASTDAVRRAAFPADEPLDPGGEAAAAALAGQLPKADRCWTSPELRARQTARALGLTAVVEPQLRDCDYGAWSGRSFDAVAAREPDAIAAWLRDPSVTPHGGESLEALLRRVAAWLDAQAALPGRITVVTHAGIIRAALVHAIAATPATFWRLDIAPLSVARLSGHDGRWNLTALGPPSPQG